MAEMTHIEKMMAEMMAKMAAVNRLKGHANVEAAEAEDDVIRYETEDILELIRLDRNITEVPEEERPEAVRIWKEKLSSLREKENPCERIYLWKEGNMPSATEYTDNSDFFYNHDPDFRPYLYEMPVPEAVTPKGAVVVCAGGAHGDATPFEGYQVARDLNALGYQCLLLLNRVNHNPWQKPDVAADTARAIRYARKNAERLRIDPANVAFAGFSNGGLTGEACIELFSGKKTVKDYFPDYVPDELDSWSGRPDCFLCVYGPRQIGMSFDWDDVDYPPTFFAVGRKDGAMDNLAYVYPDLIAHGVTVEVHTFAGTPHGQAGGSLHEYRYPNFELWEELADSFMQDVYGKYEPVRN